MILFIYLLLDLNFLHYDKHFYLQNLLLNDINHPLFIYHLKIDFPILFLYEHLSLNLLYHIFIIRLLFFLLVYIFHEKIRVFGTKKYVFYKDNLRALQRKHTFNTLINRLK